VPEILVICLVLLAGVSSMSVDSRSKARYSIRAEIAAN